MSTLAKVFLKSKEKYPLTTNERLHKLQSWTHNFVRVRLLAPVPGTIGVAPDDCAERFIFDVDPTVVTGQLIDSGAIDSKLVMETVHFPATNFWIEFPHEEIRIGFMVGALGEREGFPEQQIGVAMVACNSDHTNARCCAFVTIPRAEIMPNKTYATCFWFLDKVSVQLSDHETEEIVYALYDLAHCLFMINTPRVSEHRVSTIGSHGKRALKDPTTFPAVEVKRMVLKVGVGAPRYPHSSNPSGAMSVESADARHRRLHRVIGHFRTYREGRERPHVSYVPQHWRGDAEIGILLHERVVKK